MTRVQALEKFGIDLDPVQRSTSDGVGASQHGDRTTNDTAKRSRPERGVRGRDSREIAENQRGRSGDESSGAAIAASARRTTSRTGPSGKTPVAAAQMPARISTGRRPRGSSHEQNVRGCGPSGVVDGKSRGPLLEQELPSAHDIADKQPQEKIPAVVAPHSMRTEEATMIMPSPDRKDEVGRDESPPNLHPTDAVQGVETACPPGRALPDHRQAETHAIGFIGRVCFPPRATDCRVEWLTGSPCARARRAF